MVYRLLVRYSFIIFGWGNSKQKDYGEVYPMNCSRCNNEVFYHYLKTWKRFSLFFIPLIPYGRKHFLTCPVCGASVKLDKFERKLVKEIRQDLDESGGKFTEEIEKKMDELGDKFEEDTDNE